MKKNFFFFTQKGQYHIGWPRNTSFFVDHHTLLGVTYVFSPVSLLVSHLSNIKCPTAAHGTKEQNKCGKTFFWGEIFFSFLEKHFFFQFFFFKFFLSFFSFIYLFIYFVYFVYLIIYFYYFLLERDIIISGNHVILGAYLFSFFSLFLFFLLQRELITLGYHDITWVL